MRISGPCITFEISLFLDGFAVWSIVHFSSIQKDMTRPLQGDDADAAKAKLYVQPTPGRFGDVDAAYLIQTEWPHDAASERIKASIQAWREQFKAKHADSEPKLWIDRYSKL